MRGHPLVRLLFTTLAFSLAGAIVWTVTQPHSEIREHLVNSQKNTSLPTELQFEFLSPIMPTHYEVTIDNKIIISEDSLSNSESSLDTSLLQTIIYPPDGADVIVRAEWKKNTSVALRLIIRNDAQQLVSGEFWGRGKIADTITLPPLSK